MQIGKLNRRVVLESPGVGQDSIGQPTQVWTPVATVWANVRYLSGVEAIKADAVTSAAKASIRIRYRAGVTPGMRVTLGATIFNVLAVMPDEQTRNHLDLACEALS